MPFLAIRFDFRNPPFTGVAMSDRYAAALDMVVWAEEHGFDQVVLSEHHGEPDGFVSSPLVLAAAIAARTSRISVQIAAMITSMHDPLRLAEDLAAVDLLSRGRLAVVLANGYVPREFAMFDRPMAERVPRTEETVRTLRQAWTGEPFEFRGRTVRVTPAPHTPGGPKILLGAASERAARRAARLADGFVPSYPQLWDFYRDELRVLGRPDPGPYLGGDTSFVHVAADPDAVWPLIAPHALHETNAYGDSSPEAQIGGYRAVTDADELRAAGHYRVLTPEELVAELTGPAGRPFLVCHPMMGGIPPELAWDGLRLLADRVLPALAEADPAGG
ncbi:LLM class flavin-dependent oxidoreductase [Solihabitans fulvus]|uniref:LLM class flavin-dependent oxidoreductase n=1 Tax=Solihabitans fulvus TaxID=1892852 RepID=A0A5B2WNK8_9PSEU|nr:LLM class flavin-dependent oxidoreductase [Solihabitans fulvus]KAA2252574.1 LLM class flavin-dependent oxidoreductase [Solihabitans fulvus]